MPLISVKYNTRASIQHSLPVKSLVLCIIRASGIPQSPFSLWPQMLFLLRVLITTVSDVSRFSYLSNLCMHPLLGSGSKQIWTKAADSLHSQSVSGWFAFIAHLPSPLALSGDDGVGSLMPHLQSGNVGVVQVKSVEAGCITSASRSPFLSVRTQNSAFHHLTVISSHIHTEQSFNPSRSKLTGPGLFDPNIERFNKLVLMSFHTSTMRSIFFLRTDFSIVVFAFV